MSSFFYRFSGFHPTPTRFSWHLDRPNADALAAGGAGLSLTLGGWVADPRLPFATVALYAPLFHRAPLAVAPLHARPDVTAALDLPPDRASGFLLRVPLLGLPEKAELVLAAVPDPLAPAFETDASWRARHFEPLARFEIDIDCPPPAPDDAPGPTPLFVTSLGRSGSTALMAALTAHPAIGGTCTYPFEARPLQHALHLFRLWLHPALAHAPIAQEQFADTPFLASANPFYHAEDYPDLFDHFEESGLAQFRSLARQALKGLSPRERGFRYWAEKTVPNTPFPWLAGSISPGMGEIILVRDPISWLASGLGFGRDGKAFFGDGNAPGAARRIAVDIGAFADYIEHRARKALLVRSEDLTRDPETALARIASHLGLPFDAGMVAALQRLPPSHRSAPVSDTLFASFLSHPDLSAALQRLERIHAAIPAG